MRSFIAPPTVINPLRFLLLRLYLFIATRLCFSGIYLHTDRPETSPITNVILCPNHASWWDGFFACLVNSYHFKRDIRIVMLAEELVKVSFFASVGAIGISPGKPAALARSFRWINKFLSTGDSPTLLTFFPQGKLLPLSSPYKLQQGLRLIKTEEKTGIVPAYFHTEAGRTWRPKIFIKLSAETISLDEYRQNPEILRERLESLRTSVQEQLEEKNHWETLIGRSYAGY